MGRILCIYIIKYSTIRNLLYFFYKMYTMLIQTGAPARPVGTLARFLEKGAVWNVFSSPRAAFRHPRSPFWWPGVPILTPVGSILVACWTSGPGLRRQWGTLAHFLEKGVKKGHKWTSNWTSKWDGFRYIFSIFIILRVLWRALGGHLMIYWYIYILIYW